MMTPLKVSALAAACVICAVALSSCAPRRNGASAAPVAGKRFELELVPGPMFRASTGFLFFRIHHSPQIACWLETPQGAYVETIYVTTKGAAAIGLLGPG